MTTRIKIDTKRTPAEIEATIRSLARPEEAQDAFLSGFALSWFASVTKAFDIKTSGGSDDLGQSWLPHSEYTTRQKMGMMGITHYRKPQAKDKLRVSEKRLWNKLYGLAYQKQESILLKANYKYDAKELRTISDAKAKVAAWAGLYSSKSSGKSGGKSLFPINVDTGYTRESLRPASLQRVEGSFSYQPRKFQIYEKQANGVQLGTEAPNAYKTHAGHTKKVRTDRGRTKEIKIPARPLFPDSSTMRPWIIKAARNGLKMTANYLAKEFN